MSIWHPSAVWKYPERTLTQEKFPFWSSIITQSHGEVSVDGESMTYVTIQPPSGETWLVWIDFLMASSASPSHVRYYQFDGTVRILHRGTDFNASVEPHLGVLKILTHSLYASLRFYNGDTNPMTGYYGYSGFKLSRPLWTPKREDSLAPARVWKKPTTKSLPENIKPLQKYAYEFLGLSPNKPNEYALGVILEEDKVLAVDPETNFPVERLTAVVEAETLSNLIKQFKEGTLSPEETGYRKYLDKWESEGIRLV
ncbi:MAG: hypothetical protein DRP01_02205 [Archaeoglobales archaeon]|nr:MAG: hypothetical protein DRP01_02205 [Archaeoglobales archaeon]